MIRNILLTSIIAQWVILAFSPWGFGTSFSPQPFPKTVQDAPVIVRGKVGMSYADWGKDADDGKRLFTYYDLQVSEILKGDASRPSLVMREMGGEKDGVGLHVPGASEFEKGEDVVVFLKEKNSEGSYDVQGMMMGKYNLQKDSEGTEYLTGAGTFGEADPQQPNVPPKKWFIEDLRQLIRSQGQSAPPPPLVKTTQLPEVKENPSPIPSPPMTHTPEAPHLQIQTIETENSSSGVLLYSGLGLGLVGILTAFWILHRKK